MLSEPIFEIGPFKFHMYGFMIAVGVAAALFVLYFYGRKKNVSDKFLDFFFYNTLAAILGGFGSAALFQAIYDYIEDPSKGFSFNGRITFLGGLIGGVVIFLTIYFIMRPKLKGRLVQMISIAPCAILVGHGFGRIGCFFAGCCHGAETDSFLGVIFPGRTSSPVHPTQLYEAAFLFLMFAVCSYLVLKKNFRYNMCIYLASYGIFRFCLEFLRGDDRGEFLLGMSPSQFWSLIMIFASVEVYFMLRRAFRVYDAEQAACVENGGDGEEDAENEDEVVSSFSSDDE